MDICSIAFDRRLRLVRSRLCPKVSDSIVEATLRKLTHRYWRWMRYRATAGKRRRVPVGRMALLSIGGQTARPVRVLGDGSLPAVMCLDRNYAETVAVLTDLRVRTMTRMRGRLLIPSGRRASRIGWVRNFRDFTPLKSISAGAALMLAAEYDRIGRLSGFPPATVDIHLWDLEVKATLAGLGFFELLKLDVDSTPLHGGLLIEPMVSGSDVNMAPVNDAIAALFQKVGGDLGMRVQMASAVTDAVENVRGHAYPTEWFDLLNRACRFGGLPAPLTKLPAA